MATRSRAPRPLGSGGRLDGNLAPRSDANEQQSWKSGAKYKERLWRLVCFACQSKWHSHNNNNNDKARARTINNDKIIQVHITRLRGCHSARPLALSPSRRPLTKGQKAPLMSQWVGRAISLLSSAGVCGPELGLFAKCRSFPSSCVEPPSISI